MLFAARAETGKKRVTRHSLLVSLSGDTVVVGTVALCTLQCIGRGGS